MTARKHRPGKFSEEVRAERINLRVRLDRLTDAHYVAPVGSPREAALDLAIDRVENLLGSRA